MKTIKKLLLVSLIAGGMVNQASALSWNPSSWFNRNNKQTAAEQLIAQNAQERRNEQIKKCKTTLKNLLKRNLNPKTARGLITISLTLAALAFGTDYATGGLVYATAKSAVHASGIISLVKKLVTVCPDLGISTTLKAALTQANAYAAPYMGQAAGYFTTAFAYSLTKASQAQDFATPYIAEAAAYCTPAIAFVATKASQVNDFATPYMTKVATYCAPAITFALAQGSKAQSYAASFLS